MVADEYPRLLIYLDDEECQGLVVLIFAPSKEDPPELRPVDGVVSLLKVDEGCIVTPLLSLPRVNLG